MKTHPACFHLQCSGHSFSVLLHGPEYRASASTEQEFKCFQEAKSINHNGVLHQMQLINIIKRLSYKSKAHINPYNESTSTDKEFFTIFHDLVHFLQSELRRKISGFLSYNVVVYQIPLQSIYYTKQKAVELNIPPPKRIWK